MRLVLSDHQPSRRIGPLRSNDLTVFSETVPLIQIMRVVAETTLTDTLPTGMMTSPDTDEVEVLQSRIDRLAFESQHSEDALVDSAKRFMPRKSFQPFNAECKLAQSERSLRSQSALPQPQ